MQRGVKSELPELGPGKGAQTSRGLRRRGLILKVAATLFAEHGFDSVSINEVGKFVDLMPKCTWRPHGKLPDEGDTDGRGQEKDGDPKSCLYHNTSATWDNLGQCRRLSVAAKLAAKRGHSRA